MEDPLKGILDWRITIAPSFRILAYMVICFASGYRLSRFVEGDWLKEISGRKRDRIYTIEPCIDTF